MKEEFISVTCPFCGAETDILIEIESQSDYYFDSCCDSCNKEIKQINVNGKFERVEDVVYDAVMDNYAARADLLYDDFRELNFQNATK